MTKNKVLYSMGDCPVCAGAGAILVLRAMETGSLIFYCPFCGVAWHTPPSPHVLDEVLSLKDLAPSGVALPTREAIDRSGYGGQVSEALPYEDWGTFLDGHIKSSSD